VLTTSYASTHYLASLDGGVYFDLTVHTALHLDRLDVNLMSPPGTPGTVEVFVRPGTWVGNVAPGTDWVLAASGPFSAAGTDLPTPCVLSAPIGLPTGSYGIALHVRGALPLYSFAFGPRSFSNADLRLTAGGSALQFLTSAPFQWRVFNGALHYTVAPGAYQTATVQRFGEGCLQGARSFHELFAPGDFDLAHQRLVLTPNGDGGYDVARTAGGPVVIPAGAQSLGLARNGAAFVPLQAPLPFPGGSTPTLLVLADGRVMLTDEGLVGSAPTQPSPAALLASQPTVAVAWADLAPSGADNVFAAVDPAAGTTTIVWWNVPVFGAPVASGNTFAFVAHGDGRLELCLGAVSNPTNACLVGFGAGFGARDPGPRDLSLVTAFATQLDDPGLQLAAFGRPVLGTTTTLRVTDAPAATPLTALLLGWDAVVPGIDLGGLGAPTCSLFVAPAAACWLGLPGSHAFPFVLPADAGLLGLRCHAQGFALAPARNALGLVSSNALSLTFGSV
jgi:hypothetical protein